MTPYEIKFLLACHCAPTPSDAHKLGKETADNMKIAGLIRRADDDSGWVTTGRGEAHVRQLCALDLPQQAWVNGAGELIAGEFVF